MVDRSSGRDDPFRNVRCTLVVALVLVLLMAVAAPSGRASGVSSRIGTAPIRPDANGTVCNGEEETVGHLSVGVSGCQAVFAVGYDANYTYYYNSTNLTLNTTSQYNLTFALSWIAEITPEGQVVRVATPLDPFAAGTGPFSAAAGGDGGPPASANSIVVGDFEDMNVTNASGPWSPNETAPGAVSSWNVSSSPVGTAWMIGSFSLQNVSANSSASPIGNASYSVEFSVFFEGWPWASPADHLGFVLSTLGASGSHFSFNATSSSLAESWNLTNRTFVRMVFGPSAFVNATTTFPETPAVASVGEQVGLFSAASYDRDAQVLVSFGGVTGGFWNVTYDPWVVFFPTAVVSPPPPPIHLSSGVPSWVWVAVAMVAVTAGLAGIFGFTLRDLYLHREGRRLVDGMRRAISDAPKPPNRGG